VAESRFHLPPDELAKPRPELTGPALAHAAARRLRAGQVVSLFDGQGGEALARVERIGRGRIGLQVLSRPEPLEEPPLRLTLGLGLLRWERLRLAVEKATELGAGAICPLRTERSQPERAGQREKLIQVVTESLKQCYRSRGPLIHPVMNLSQALDLARRAELRLVLDRAGLPLVGLLDRAAAPEEVFLLVGPEGGFSPVELAAAEAAGFRPAGLTPAVLRSETAALAAAALIQARWSEAGPEAAV